MSEDRQAKIIGYIDYIKKNFREQRYFAFDTGRKFIVDGKKIKMLPTEYAKLNSKNEFYINVDPDAKKVIYYAFDLESLTDKEKTNEELGNFEWDKVVEQIYSFITLHLKELTTANTPYLDMDNGGKSSSSDWSSRPTSVPSSESWRNPTRQYDTSSSYNSSSYNSSSYKEREAFSGKVMDLLKECKTSSAIDFVSNTLAKMCEDKKFDDIDLVLRWLTFDKLNIPVMLAILSTTRGADHILKERKEFYGKVKTHLTKIRPAKAEYFLRDLEPGKEYKGFPISAAK
jgi:hypothetical protein